tara:strand:- start:302 stop:517 length:216 start_codon:yes stop_codon:yes gene_type:complete
MLFLKWDFSIQYDFKFLSYLIPKKFLLKILVAIPIGKIIKKNIIPIINGKKKFPKKIPILDQSLIIDVKNF